jgi:hypothetical protein
MGIFADFRTACCLSPSLHRPVPDYHARLISITKVLHSEPVISETALTFNVDVYEDRNDFSRSPTVMVTIRVATTRALPFPRWRHQIFAYYLPVNLSRQFPHNEKDLFLNRVWVGEFLRLYSRLLCCVFECIRPLDFRRGRLFPFTIDPSPGCGSSIAFHLSSNIAWSGFINRLSSHINEFSPISIYTPSAGPLQYRGKLHW